MTAPPVWNLFAIFCPDHFSAIRARIRVWQAGTIILAFLDPGGSAGGNFHAVVCKLQLTPGLFPAERVRKSLGFDQLAVIQIESDLIFHF